MPGSLVVINPHASKAREASTLAALVERAREVLAERDGVAPRLVETRAAEEVAPLVRDALDEGVAAVVGVGGDGTMREIASVLEGTDVPLGVVPAGTGNQIASALGIPRPPIEALDALVEAEPRTIDLGAATIEADGATTSSMFLIGCGAGFDAELMATTSPRLKRAIGTAAYFVHGARLALRLSATPCRLTIDGRVIEANPSTVLVGNMGHLIPGRLDLRLPIDPSDGLLDLIVVEGTSLVRGVRGLIETMRRTELGGDEGACSMRLRGRHITIEPKQPMPLEIDGDHCGSGSFEARIVPAALRVLVPPT